MRRPPEFDTFTKRHAGVFRRRDAIALGMSPKRFEVGASRHEWVRFGRVWILSDAAQTQTANTWAAILILGPSARITGMTSLDLHGLTIDRWQLHLGVEPNNSRTIAQAVVLRDNCRIQTDSSIQGFPSVTRSRAIVDALRILDDRAGREVLHEALLVRLLENAHLTGWTFNQTIRDPEGCVIGIGDCVDTTCKILIEVDGMAWHTSSDRFQRDRTRQNALINAGWHVLRFTWADLAERPDAVIQHIRAALRARKGQAV